MSGRTRSQNRNRSRGRNRNRGMMGGSHAAANVANAVEENSFCGGAVRVCL